MPWESVLSTPTSADTLTLAAAAAAQRATYREVEAAGFGDEELVAHVALLNHHRVRAHFSELRVLHEESDRFLGEAREQLALLQNAPCRKEWKVSKVK